MQTSDIPAKFPIPFADAAVPPYINTVPQNPTGTPGKASLSVGFPPENFSPVAAGGVPPFGNDFNGILNQSTSWDQWQATGRAFPPYDATFQSAIAGYPRGSIVESLVSPNLYYYSTAENNVTNPDTGGAGWIVFWRQLLANTDLYVDASTGNDANNGLSPVTAKKTIGAAVRTAWTFSPNPQFGITIHVATGTYAEAVITPTFAGSAVTIDGNVAANVLVTATTNNAFTVRGPNTMLVKNVTVATSGGVLAGFVALSGATMTTLNTASNSLSGSIFGASASGNLSPGAHTANGNAASLFFANNAGTISPPDSTNYTFGSSLTFSQATAQTFLCGIINMPIGNPCTFTNPGNVSGKRYDAQGNGVIYQAGLGASYFPGSAGGTTATGGQAIT